MIPNSDITIYNRYIENRAEKFHRTIIKSVVWESTSAISGQTTGRLSSNVATVMIPFALTTEYITPKAWRELADKTGYWTLQNDDVIVRGQATEDITDAVTDPETEEVTPAYTITNLRADYEEVVFISSIDSMDQGTFDVQHFEVGCK